MTKEVILILATEKDAELLHNMKYEAFLPLYNKYHDDETSPVMESIDKVIWKLTHPNSEYYIIQADGENAGAICVRHNKQQEDSNCEYISPLFILPKFQNQGIAQAAINKVFELYPNTVAWRLDTIKQEAGNCHLYEKCGFVRTGVEHMVNENMTLIDYEKVVKKPMEPITIRPAKTEDYTNIEKIMKQVQQLHIDWRPDIYKETETVLPYDAFCDAVQKETLVVAEVAGEVAGLLSYIPRHIASGVQVTREVLYIDSMAVDEKYRGNGIGHQLFDYIKNIAREKNFDGIELQVNAKNMAAKKMYESYGFTEKSITMELL